MTSTYAQERGCRERGNLLSFDWLRYTESKGATGLGSRGSMGLVPEPRDTTNQPRYPKISWSWATIA